MKGANPSKGAGRAQTCLPAVDLNDWADHVFNEVEAKALCTDMDTHTTFDQIVGTSFEEAADKFAGDDSNGSLADWRSWRA